jgi:isoquinoline 1-oxidoreductase subunit beta
MIQLIRPTQDGVEEKSRTGLTGVIRRIRFQWSVTFRPMEGVKVDTIGLEPRKTERFLKIDHSGKVTLLTQKAEVGQGIKTAFPIIIAEESDVY